MGGCTSLQKKENGRDVINTIIKEEPKPEPKEQTVQKAQKVENLVIIDPPKFKKIPRLNLRKSNLWQKRVESQSFPDLNILETPRSKSPASKDNKVDMNKQKGKSHRRRATVDQMVAINSFKAKVPSMNRKRDEFTTNQLTERNTNNRKHEDFEGGKSDETIVQNI